MCGRFDRHSELDEFAQLIEGLVVEGAPELPGSYNIAPSQDALAIGTNADGIRKVAALNWGLVPSWSKKKALNRPINARVETVAEKPMFRSGFSRHRCLVPCDGYYEWAAIDGGKQPYYFHSAQRRPFFIAGIWDHNEHLEAHTIHTFCLLTREAAGAVQQVHHRMPFILAGHEIDLWLDAKSTKNDLHELMTSEPKTDLDFYPVSTFVNSPANNSPRCLEALGNL